MRLRHVMCELASMPAFKIRLPGTSIATPGASD